MASNGLHISINAETLFKLGGLEISNSIFTSLIASSLLIFAAYWTHKQIKETNHPTGWQNFIEWIVESLLGLAESVTGDREKSWQFLPFIGSFFFFILLNNWLGLMPGVGTIGLIKDHTAQTEQRQVYAAEETHEEETHEEEARTSFVPLFRPGTADINTTLALGIASILLIQIMGTSHLGLSYFKKFINFSDPVMFFVGFLELISEFAKIISFAFRLFGNIFAGEVLLVVIAFLLPIAAPIPFYGLELFFGFIQALVFAMLSLVFFNMATQGHNDH